MTRVVVESKVRARRRRRRALIAALALLALVIVFGVLAGLANLPGLSLTQVEVSGVPGDEATLVQQYAAAQLSGDYLFIFPRNNDFLYPKQAITRGLLAQFGSLESVSLHRVGTHTLAIDAAPRAPVALWCGVEVASSSACFLLDDKGLAYAALTIAGGGFDRYFGALSASTTPAQFLSPSTFPPLLSLIAALKQKDASGVMSVFVDQNQDVTVSFEDGFSLLFALADTNTTFQRFTLALQSDVFTEHPLSDFEYLDLRFGDKLYYKLKNQ